MRKQTVWAVVLVVLLIPRVLLGIGEIVHLSHVSRVSKWHRLVILI